MNLVYIAGGIAKVMSPDGTPLGLVEFHTKGVNFYPFNGYIKAPSLDDAIVIYGK